MRVVSFVNHYGGVEKFALVSNARRGFRHGVGMPVKITTRPALSAKSMPSETFPLQTAKNMAPPFAANVTAVSSSFALPSVFVKPTLLKCSFSNVRRFVERLERF